MSRYAANTSVSPARSRAEIEETLARYGATGFMYAWEEREGIRHEVIIFKASERHVRFEMPMPSQRDKRFWQTPARGKRRSSDAAYREWEKACRQKWRALLLAIKAKLEVVEAEIATFEQEFMAHIVMPDGLTVGQHVLPKVAKAYLSGKMPKLLPAFTGPPTVEGEVVD